MVDVVNVAVLLCVPIRAMYLPLMTLLAIVSWWKWVAVFSSVLVVSHVVPRDVDFESFPSLIICAPHVADVCVLNALYPDLIAVACDGYIQEDCEIVQQGCENACRV